MKGLINSDGNYAVVINSDKQRVDVTVYASKEKYDSDINPFFEKVTNGNFHCGEELNEAYKATAASGVGGRTVATNVVEVAEVVVATQALENPDRFRIQYNPPSTEPIYIKGDWTVWEAASI